MTNPNRINHKLLNNLSREIDKRNEKALLNTPVKVRCLTPAEAIGTTGDWDFPLLRNKEVLLQAKFGESYGQAFTANPLSYEGLFSDVLKLDLSHLDNLAIFIAAANALLREIGLIDQTLHCRNDEPELCSRHLAEFIKKEFNPGSIGIVGYQPAIINTITANFDPQKIMVTDLNPENIGKCCNGVIIEDGIGNTERLLAGSEVILATGSVFANNTGQLFYEAHLSGKPVFFFGTTVAGAAYLLKLKHLCPLGA